MFPGRKSARRTISGEVAGHASTSRAPEPDIEADANMGPTPDVPPTEDADRLSATNSEVESAMNHRRCRAILVTPTMLVELPLELGCVTCTGIVGTCNCFGRICESRGLSNLTPARSRLFKLIGKKGVMRWSCNGKAYMVANIRKESEKRSNGAVVN